MSFAGASGAQKYTWGIFRQIGAAADKGEWEKVVKLAAQCDQSPIPNVPCPGIHKKTVADVAQSRDLQLKLIWWLRDMLGTNDWWGNPISDPKKADQTKQAAAQGIRQLQELIKPVSFEEELQILQTTLPLPEPEPSFLRRNLTVLTLGGGSLLLGLVGMVLLVKV